MLDRQEFAVGQVKDVLIRGQEVIQIFVMVPDLLAQLKGPQDFRLALLGRGFTRKNGQNVGQNFRLK